MKASIGKETKAAVLLLGLGLGLHSCSEEASFLDAESGMGSNVPAAFDFATKSDVNLDLNFGDYAANALISVYIANPYDVDGEHMILTREADFKIFADANGCYKGKANVPSYVDSVWVEASAFGMPGAIPAKVVNGVATVNLSALAQNESADGATRATRASEDYTIQYTYTMHKKPDYRIYSFLKWNDKSKNGAFDYNVHSSLFSDGKVEPKEMNALRTMLWNGCAKKPEWLCPLEQRLNNSGLLRQTNGTVVVKDDAEVYVTLLDENTGQRNSLGYYYYKTGQAPTAVDGLADIDKYVIFPSVAMKGNGTSPNSNQATFDTYAKSQKNMRVKLLFRDPDTGEVKDKFPAGYTIGYFSALRGYTDNGLEVKFADPFKNARDNKHRGILYTDQGWNYSPWERTVYDGKWKEDTKREDYWNMPDMKNAFVSINAQNGRLIYGMEDSFDDLGYDDIVFAVEVEPADALDPGDAPLIDLEEKLIYTTETTYKTYAYEDQWVSRGDLQGMKTDYDLNDVVIEHKRVITFDNLHNNILKIEDSFTPVQPEGSAVNQNAFAIMYNLNDIDGKLELPEGAYYESETNSIIVTPNTNADRGKTITITRNMRQGIKKSSFSEDIDPYIISKYVQGASDRMEVHFSGHVGTKMAMSAQRNATNNPYGAYEDIVTNKFDVNTFPWAISLPVYNFQSAPEGVRIDKYYGQYPEWVASKGTKNQSWYLYPVE